MEPWRKGGISPRLVRETLERPLLPDRTEAASAILLSLESPFGWSVEFLGLSVFEPPGILDRSALKDREESLVSDLLKDGYDCRLPSPEAEPLGEEPPSLEAELPMVAV